MKNQYLYASILLIGLVSCGESKSPQENELSENIAINITDTINELTADVIEEVDEVKTDFNLFDDYATILTKDDLIAQFGKENLEDRTVWYAEGTVERQSTILTNPNNDHVIKYVWAEEDNVTTSWIEATHYLWDEDFNRHGTQTIETINGLKLGMSLEDLKKWNEADIKFSGFGWDYAGNVFVQSGSKLAESNVQLTLLNDQDKSNEGFDFMLGDVELNTAEERLNNAPVLVEMFSIYIEKE